MRRPERREDGRLVPPEKLRVEMRFAQVLHHVAQGTLLLDPAGAYLVAQPQPEGVEACHSPRFLLKIDP